VQGTELTVVENLLWNLGEQRAWPCVFLSLDFCLQLKRPALQGALVQFRSKPNSRAYLSFGQS